MTKTAASQMCAPAPYVETDTIPANIQAMINYYAPKRLIQLPQGTITIGDGQELYLPSGTKLRGYGSRQTIIKSARTGLRGTLDGLIKNTHLGTATRDSDIEISDLLIDGQRTVNNSGAGYTSGFGITVENIDNLAVKRVVFKDVDADGLRINGATPGGTGTGTSKVVTLTDLYSENSGVDGAGIDQIDTLIGRNLRAKTFGNRVDAINGHGLTITRCYNIDIENAWFTDGVDGATAGIKATGLMINGSHNGRFKNVWSMNNVGCGVKINSSAPDDPMNLLFKELHAYRNQYHGVHATNADFIEIDEADLIENGFGSAGTTYDGIYFDTGTQHVTLKKVVATDQQGTKTQGYGVESGKADTGSCDYFALIDCILAGNATGFYLLRNAAGAMPNTKLQGGWIA